ncbi:MAG: TolC family outer membrane protein [Rhodospirillaceae bacterium]
MKNLGCPQVVFGGGFVLAVLLSSVAIGETLEDALTQAYVGNPTLVAARATLRSVDEGVPQARAQAHPSPAINGNAGGEVDRNNLNPYDYKWTRINPRTVGVSISQPIYKGGQIGAGISQAENTVKSQRAALFDTEQTIMLQAASAYLDLAQAQELLDIQIDFENIQRRDLGGYQARFRVSQVTLTDVNLQEAQLATATAARNSAESTLATAMSNYVKIVGTAPDQRLPLPRIDLPLPTSREEAVALARANNPKVIAAKFTEAAARDAVDISDGGLLPTVSVTASASRSLDRQMPKDRYESASLIASVSIPIDNGSVAAKSRGARQSASAARTNIEQTLRASQDAAVSAWHALATARANIALFQTAIKANEGAVKGMARQAASGFTTISDLLNTEQRLLDARVNLVKARHDEIVAVFNVLAAIGQLSAQNLKLKTPYYDYEAHYNASRGKWFGFGIGE